MNNTELKFYPEHPSGEKTHQIETTTMPILQQDAPFDVKTLCEEFAADADSFFAKYVDYRFEVTGIAKKVGPDIHSKPSIEISDRADGQTYALVIFPSDDHYSKVKVGDRVTVRANYLVMSNHYGTVMKCSELVCVKKPMIELRYPLFDGKNIWDGAAVTIEDGLVTSVTACAPEECGEGFLMPGLIDAHTHMGTSAQVETMLRSGITATCDVSAPQALVESSKQLQIISSAGMAMGMVLNPKGFVEKAALRGARYIKVLLFNTLSIGKSALNGIVRAAHAKGLKAAVHATEVSTVRQAVDAGADILLHVPMKEEFPEELAKTIAEKGIAVAPTLVMMEAYASSGRNGFKPEHYKNAEKAVKLLRENGVQILAATDANPGSFAPAVAYGTSLHREMELLVKSGMTPTEVLASATSQTAEVFGIDDLGTIKEGKRAVLFLVEGRPDKMITDTTKIKQIWIDGKPIL